MNIDDVNYYNDDFKNINIQKIITKYFKIINDYLSYFSKNIELEENKEFIMKRGINVINNVFNITLMYSKNTDMTIFYSKKAHYYYCEFIQQINQDIHTYLQLTSKDAAIFVFKKTIFNINGEFKKEYNMDNKSAEILKKVKDLTEMIDKIISNCNSKKIKNIINRANEIKCMDIPFVLLFELNNNHLSQEKYGNIFYKFLKKYSKHMISRNQLLTKINTEGFKTNMHTMNSLKFVNWLFV